MIRIYLILLFTVAFSAQGETVETCQTKLAQRFAHMGPMHLAAAEHRVELKVHASAWWGFRGMQVLVDERELALLGNESEELGLTFAQDRRTDPAQEATTVAKRVQEVVNAAFIKKSTLQIDFSRLRAVLGFRGNCLIDGYSFVDVIKEEVISKPQPPPEPPQPPVPPVPPTSSRGDRSETLPEGQRLPGMKVLPGGDR